MSTGSCLKLQYEKVPAPMIFICFLAVGSDERLFKALASEPGSNSSFGGGGGFRRSIFKDNVKNGKSHKLRT